MDCWLVGVETLMRGFGVMRGFRGREREEDEREGGRRENGDGEGGEEMYQEEEEDW